MSYLRTQGPDSQGALFKGLQGARNALAGFRARAAGYERVPSGETGARPPSRKYNAAGKTSRGVALSRGDPVDTEGGKRGMRKNLLAFSAWNVFNFATLVAPAAVYFGIDSLALRTPGVAVMSILFLFMMAIGLEESPRVVKLFMWFALFVDIAAPSVFFFTGLGGRAQYTFLESIYFYTGVVASSTNIPLLLCT